MSTERQQACPIRGKQRQRIIGAHESIVAYPRYHFSLRLARKAGRMPLIRNGTGFGDKVMSKFGWEQGKGLGAKEDGISEYIRVQKKKDTFGLGARNGPQWNEPYWENMLNDAFGTIGEKAAEGGTNAASIDETAVDQDQDPLPDTPLYRLFVRGDVIDTTVMQKTLKRQRLESEAGPRDGNSRTLATQGLISVDGVPIQFGMHGRQRSIGKLARIEAMEAAERAKRAGDSQDSEFSPGGVSRNEISEVKQQELYDKVFENSSKGRKGLGRKSAPIFSALEQYAGNKITFKEGVECTESNVKERRWRATKPKL